MILILFFGYSYIAFRTHSVTNTLLYLPKIQYYQDAIDNNSLLVTLWSIVRSIRSVPARVPPIPIFPPHSLLSPFISLIFDRPIYLYHVPILQTCNPYYGQILQTHSNKVTRTLVLLGYLPRTKSFQSVHFSAKYRSDVV